LSFYKYAGSGWFSTNQTTALHIDIIGIDMTKGLNLDCDAYCVYRVYQKDKKKKYANYTYDKNF